MARRLLPSGVSSFQVFGAEWLDELEPNIIRCEMFNGFHTDDYRKSLERSATDSVLRGAIEEIRKSIKVEWRGDVVRASLEMPPRSEGAVKYVAIGPRPKVAK